MSISSRVWEWWHSWVPPSALVVVDPLPELDANEHIARRCHAILVGRTPSPKGQLVLTTHRLIYRPLVHQAERAFFGSRIARSMMPMVLIDLC